MPRKPAGTENRAGELYGKIASAKPNTATQITGDSNVSTKAVSRPIAPPHAAPRVVQPDQTQPSAAAGRLQRVEPPEMPRAEHRHPQFHRTKPFPQNTY